MSDNITLVPSYIIHLNGSRVPLKIESRVKELTVIERVNAPSTFSILFSDPEIELSDLGDFSEGTAIKISMGYKDEIEELFSGEVTGVAPYFEDGFKVSLVIKGSDKLHRLNRGKKTVSFSNMTEGDIVKQIASGIQLSTDVAAIGKQQPFILQKDLTDFEYLRYLGRKFNCIMWCQKDKFFFKPIEASAQENTIVEWGKTLINFRPELNSQFLPTEVEVRGWDPAKFEPVTGAAAAGDVSAKLGGSKLGLNAVNDNYGAAKLTYVDESIMDTGTADKVAKNILTDISFNYVTGHGKTFGDPKIRGASIIMIKEVGKRFSGKYFVEKATHHLSPQGGYLTTFYVKRNCVG